MRISKDVEAWFARYENPMKPAVQRLREIVLGADPRIGECIKWGAPTFTFEGNLASFFPKSKAHASLMFHQGALIPGRHPRLEGSASVGRVLRVASVAEADEARRDLEKLVKAWCDWRAEAVAAPAPKRKPFAKAVAARNPPRRRAGAKR
jgi:uncharacterized protein YdhG (YjbR/CyaY superfamily)